ncbi:4-alpha-glucanotransferase [Exilibacterium tricleocarpae]|uniref:4-alpha-glucanotransferase n=1 Tax=Exilibacterium tricleocarpae TaxID=2591008 RepID=A0A545TSE1_9GAMM|nr:4-alpha-glucanotransferase [Exilibacterium tricleocarpae]TQV80061.1 4-alpha-glucanotransferase [Exilibacterium tricleocarpae]
MRTEGPRCDLNSRGPKTRKWNPSHGLDAPGAQLEQSYGDSENDGRTTICTTPCNPPAGFCRGERMSALERLAALAGIEPAYHDIWGEQHRADPQTQRALLAAMGFAVADENQVAASLQQLEELEWRRVLPPAVIVAAEQAQPEVLLALPEAAQLGAVEVVCEDGGSRPDPPAATLRLLGTRDIDGCSYRRYARSLPGQLPPGYHRLSVTYELAGRAAHAATTLIVAPRQCYGPADFDGDRLWGLGAQLYALRSDHNWGVGDFSDLNELVARAARAGAAAVGVNPLHPLYPGDPEICSPYSPTSRSFLNTLYIDVTAVADLAGCAAANDLLDSAEWQARLARLRAAGQLDYGAVAACKQRLLTLIYAGFCETDLGQDTPRGRAFADYCAARDPALERLATFDALYEHFCGRDGGRRWQQWPPEFQQPDTAAVKSFVAAHSDRVNYFKYLQWLAEEQLAAAAATAAAMPVGLYLDLAVGCDAGGADVWAAQDLYVRDTCIGAPPDQFCAAGQNWGLTPINPYTLREQGYAPFIALLRDNMRYAGALRIDHVMGLMRQFWVPPGQSAGAGLYINFPLQDLLRIIALESQRARCVVVGEDLGTVPEGFRDTMAEAGIQSYRVLYFERWDNGWFKRPDAYPGNAVVTVSTHDLPPLAGWWNGCDIACRQELGLYEKPADADRELRHRTGDRHALVDALVDVGALPPDTSVDDLPLETLLSATQAYLARTPGWLQMIALEDALGVEQQTNLPGTIHEHPNWRRRLPVPIETIFGTANLRALLLGVAHERSLAG